MPTAVVPQGAALHYVGEAGVDAKVTVVPVGREFVSPQYLVAREAVVADGGVSVIRVAVLIHRSSNANSHARRDIVFASSGLAGRVCESAPWVGIQAKLQRFGSIFVGTTSVKPVILFCECQVRSQDFLVDTILPLPLPCVQSSVEGRCGGAAYSSVVGEVTVGHTGRAVGQVTAEFGSQ